MAESDDALLARWRETLATIRAYDGQVLDPVDRQTLNELRAALTRAEEELDRRGLRRGSERESGGWQPLTLHDAPPSAEAPAVELTWEKKKKREQTGASDTLSWAELLEEVSEEDEYVRQMLAREPTALREEFQRSFERDLGPPAAELPARTRAPPFVPDEKDGLTSEQRVLVSLLANESRAPGELIDAARRFGAASTFEVALAQLRRPRCYPLLAEEGGRLALSPLARELITTDPSGRAIVHGALFPNFLVNGCSDGRAFPNRELGNVYRAIEMMMLNAATPDESLVGVLGSPRFETRERLVDTNDSRGLISSVLLRRPPTRLVEEKALAFHFDEAEAVDRASAALVLGNTLGEFEEDTSFEVRDGRTLVVRLPARVTGIAVTRRLLHDGVLDTRWAYPTEGPLAERPWVMLSRFLERCRQHVEPQLRAVLRVPNARRDVLVALLRVADDERLTRLIGAADSNAEAVWALTRLGTPELARHSRLGAFEVAGPPFTESEAQAIVARDGLHRKRTFLELELEALERSTELLFGSITATRVDDRLRAEFDRVRRLARR